MDIVKIDIDLENEPLKVSKAQWFLKYSFNKELKIILERCDNKAKNYNITQEREFRCTVDHCNKSFISSHLLEQHIKMVHDIENKSFWSLCNNCQKYVKNWEHHLLECSGRVERKFPCSFIGCKSVFFTKQTLKIHQKYVHEKFRYFCHNCGKKVSNLRMHLESCLYDGNEKFYCTVENCNSSFKSKSGVTDHVRRVHSQPLKCPLEDCDAYVKPRGMSVHIRRVHNRIKVACKRCGKHVFNLRYHLDICTSDGVKRFFCQVNNCKAMFISKHYLAMHVRGTHAAPIKCPHKNCDAFLKPSSLIPHLKSIHEGVRKTCQYCGGCFKALRKHKQKCHVESRS